MLSESAITLLLLAGTLAVTCWKGLVFLKRYRLISGTPTARIRSAHQGYVELKGHIVEGEDGLLTAPLSGRPCVWYEFQVLNSSESNSTTGIIERQGTSDAWFQINDGTDTCLINPAGAKVKTDETRIWYGDSLYPLNAAAAEYAGHFLSQEINLSGRRYCYKERVLYPHELIYALGQFQTVGGGRHLDPLKKIQGDVIREWKADYDNLLERFDTDGNRKIDMQEWDKVQKAARQEAGERRRAQAKTPTMHVLHYPEERSQVFLISNRDEEQIAKRYAWYAAGCGFAALAQLYSLYHLI